LNKTGETPPVPWFGARVILGAIFVALSATSAIQRSAS
jgi:hypothetical protein